MPFVYSKSFPAKKFLKILSDLLPIGIAPVYNPSSSLKSEGLTIEDNPIYLFPSLSS